MSSRLTLLALLILAACASAAVTGRSRFSSCLKAATTPTQPGAAGREPFAACHLCGVVGFSCPGLCRAAPCVSRPFDVSCPVGLRQQTVPLPTVPAAFRPGSRYFYCVVGLFVERMGRCRWGFCPQQCALCGVFGYSCPSLCRAVPANWKPYQQ